MHTILFGGYTIIIIIISTTSSAPAPLQHACQNPTFEAPHTFQVLATCKHLHTPKRKANQKEIKT
jgi:hypothetical protein